MDDRSGESQLLDTENLPLDLGKLGTVTQADLVIPGVYEAVLENYEMGLGVEAFIVLQDAADISETAKQYGKADPDHPGFLVYSEDETGNTQYIIYYELARYKILHHLPIPEGEDLQSIAALGNVSRILWRLSSPATDPMGRYHPEQDHRQWLVLAGNGAVPTWACCGLSQI